MGSCAQRLSKVDEPAARAAGKIGFLAGEGQSSGSWEALLPQGCKELLV